MNIHLTQLKVADRSGSMRPVADTASPAQTWFEGAVRAAGYDPVDQWMGGYVDYEWTHLRPLLLAYDIDLTNGNILEFGCNVGASSITMSAMGGCVTGIDIDLHMTAIATANVARYHMQDALDIQHVSDTRAMPFADGEFDFILANSVLEYVSPNLLGEVLDEITRVLKPGGVLFICGTASRLAPKEVHSGRWLVNYLPRWMDRILGKTVQRGLSPFLLRRHLREDFDDLSGDGWIAGRRAVHGRISAPVKLYSAICRLLHIAPGWTGKNIEIKLEKRN